MPDEEPEKEKLHPKGWPLEKLIEWSQGKPDYVLTEDSAPEAIVKARSKAQAEYMNVGKAQKREALERNKERVKMHYEAGTSMRMICNSYKVKRRDVEEWAVTEKWKQPTEPAEAESSEVNEVMADAEFGIVTREAEEKMPTHVRAMKQQRRLMNIRGAQWNNLPHELKQEALRMRGFDIVRKLAERVEQMDPDELLSEHKTVEKLIAMVKDVAPLPEEGGGKSKTLLHLSIFNGDEGLPVKPAKVLQLEPAAPVDVMDDPMF